MLRNRPNHNTQRAENIQEKNANRKNTEFLHNSPTMKLSTSTTHNTFPYISNEKSTRLHHFILSIEWRECKSYLRSYIYASIQKVHKLPKNNPAKVLGAEQTPNSKRSAIKPNQTSQTQHQTPLKK